MSQQLSSVATRQMPLWTYLQAELRKENAFLLPLRLFIALGWLRAGTEKIIDPLWRSGEQLTAFFQMQLASDAVYFPFYESLITGLFAPNALELSWIILVGELLVGTSILAGALTNFALIAGIFMNLNFVLAGVVNPSAFYIVIQGALLSGQAGATLGLDNVLNLTLFAFANNRSPATAADSWFARRRLLLLSGATCGLAALLAVPYIRDFGPHSVDDPAMLLFILFSLGAMLLGIHLVRLPTDNTNAPRATARLTFLPDKNAQLPHTG